MVAVHKEEVAPLKYIGDYIGGPVVQATDKTKQVSVYKNALSLVERLHRQLLDVVKDELDNNGYEELTPVQALLVYNIGDDEWSAGELKSKGCYLGSNVSYNLKKLHELGFVESQKSTYDKRQIKLRLTEEGEKVRQNLEKLFGHQASIVSPVGGIECDALESASKTLTRLERFWADQVRFRF